jgi:alkanesulfonate monooxygenase SsuD/methylene tetrahydromethanopterin reductase-like flavin-dependent oxidoreductase (luciferase family)
MEFGLFYEICVPRPWEAGKEAKIFAQVLEQVRYAEEKGFKYVWLTEHHFLQEQSHCSAPEVLLGALAVQTSTIRLGHGVVLTPPAYNHPARVAERLATIDILSGGRLEIGTGRSSTPTELEGFGIDANESREMWLEGTEALVRLLTEEEVGLDGEYVQMPPRTVVPRCVQQPHPPLWLAGTSPTTTQRAAEMGMGVLFFAHGIPPESLEENVRIYREGIGKHGSVGRSLNDRLAGFCVGLCGSDDDRARKVGGEGAFNYILRAMQYARWPQGVTPPNGYEYTLDMMWEGEKIFRELGPEGMVEQGVVMAGDPDRCNETVRRYADVGFDQLIIQMDTWDTPHDQVLESIRLFGDEIIGEYDHA